MQSFLPSRMRDYLRRQHDDDFPCAVIAYTTRVKRKTFCANTLTRLGAVLRRLDIKEELCETDAHHSRYSVRVQDLADSIV